MGGVRWTCSDRIERLAVQCTWRGSSRQDSPMLTNKERSCRTTAWKPNRLPASIVASVAMPKRHWSKRRVVISGFVVIRPFCRFEGVGGAKWSTNASACVIPTMRISMAALGKAVASAVRSGHHEITKGMRKTRSIGQDIER